MSVMARAAARIKAWRENPCLFVHENFGVTPDAWQERVLKVFPSQNRDEKRQAMQACAGPGKSAVLAWLGWNFLSCYGDKGEHPKGAAVSTTKENLKDNLWPEFSKWQQRSEYLRAAFTWTKSMIFANDHPETWFISARSWSKSANEEEQGRTLSGLHSKYVMAIIDESGDIPLTVMKAGEQALSNCTWGKILQAGNPTSMEGMLYKVAKEHAHLWHFTRITGDPDDPDRSPRIDVEWAKEQIKAFGRDNPWVMAYILGLFPPSSINSLLGPDDIAASMARVLRPAAYDFSQKRLGVDVARFGDDRTILFPRQGLQAFLPAEMRNARGPEVAARIMLARQRWNQELTFIDDTGGFGGSVCDACLLASIPHIPVNFASKAMDPRYYNMRAEMHFRAAEWVKRGGVLPNKSSLVNEATAARYTLHNGKLLIEPKEIIKKRIGKSPDEWDAFCETFALPDMPAAPPDSLTAELSGVGKLKSDWDPFQTKN